MVDASEQERGPSRPNIFISYSREDLGFVDRLGASLSARNFVPLIDREAIYAFEDWWERIENLIVKADTIVFVLSPNAVASIYCRKEVDFAASLKKRFAPIVCRPTDLRAVPDELARLNFVVFDDDAHFEEQVDRLAEALSTDIDWIRKHTEFGEAARRWSLAGRPGPKGLLLRPPLLEEAEQWIASRPQNAPHPMETTLAFIAESRRAETRRRNVLTATLGVGLAIALTLAGVAYWQRTIAMANEKIAKQQTEFANERLAVSQTNELLFLAKAAREEFQAAN